MGPMLVSTVLLAIVANSYELLCTAGFPMVYTRSLTLADLESWQYYAWLAAYNVIYVLPLLAIVAVFVKTMGARKLTEAEGRLLKLISGFMMLGFGLLLLVAPNMLTNALASIPRSRRRGGRLAGRGEGRRAPQGLSVAGPDAGSRARFARRSAAAHPVPAGPGGCIDAPELTARFLTISGVSTAAPRLSLRCPATTAEVAQVLALCNAARIAVVPQGGTPVTAAAHAERARDQLVLSLHRLNRIREVDAANFSLIAEAAAC